jgi:hypothetical protein
MCVIGVMEKDSLAIKKTSDRLQNFHLCARRTLDLQVMMNGKRIIFYENS